MHFALRSCSSMRQQCVVPRYHLLLTQKPPSSPLRIRRFSIPHSTGQTQLSKARTVLAVMVREYQLKVNVQKAPTSVYIKVWTNVLGMVPWTEVSDEPWSTSSRRDVLLKSWGGRKRGIRLGRNISAEPEQLRPGYMS